MKKRRIGKEVFAVVLLGLLFFGALLNVRYLDMFFGELHDYIDRSESYTKAGNASRAIAELEEAIGQWESHRGYICILLRQTEINSAADSFYGLLDNLRSGDGEVSAGSYAKVRYYLDSILAMEHPTLASVF